MTINPKMWDDEHFVTLSDQAKLLWCHLLTGYNGGVPGLIHQGVGAYNEALRWDQSTTEYAIKELADVRFLEFDYLKRLIRIPSRPKYVPCTNQNVLKGWLRRWRDLPESLLKYKQIESIRSALLGRSWFQVAWGETFADIKIPEASRQVPLFHIGAGMGNQLLEKNSNDTREIETNRLPFTDPIPTLNITLSPIQQTETAIRNQIRSDAFAQLADQIWEAQEEGCAQLRSNGCEGRALGLVNPAKAELIRRISERTAAGDLLSAEEDCRHVLEVLLAEAAEKKTTKWIDGAHWETRRFNMCLARSVNDTGKGKKKRDVKFGRVEPLAYEDYPEPGKKDWL